MIQRRRSSLAIAVLTTLVGCGRSNDRDTRRSGGDVGGTVVISTAGAARTLIPPLVMSDQERQVTDLVFDRLARIGPQLNAIGDRGFEPQLAQRWEWAPDSLSIAFHLDPRARWHDGVAVRASDVRFSHRLYVDSALAAPAATGIPDIDSVSVSDSLTAVVWFKRRAPTQFFEATDQLSILPEHLLAKVKPGDLKSATFAQRPVGTGRFRFVRWVPGTLVELVADTANYRGRPKLDRVVWSVSPDFTAAVTRLLAGEADFFEALRAENLSEVAKHATLAATAYPSLQYAFLQFNLREPASTGRPHALFADRALRRALTMALDRRRMVQNVLDTLGYVSIGPVPRALSIADTTIPQLPYDTVAARRTLDSLGWRRGADGVRGRDGRRLEFTILVPNASTNRVRMAVLIQEQLRLVGANARVEQLEGNAFGDRMGRRAFDAALGAWVTDASPENLRQTWTSAAAAPGGNNVGSYRSPVFDAYVDSALITADAEARRAYFRRAFETIIGDAPAVWLYEPRLAAGYHKRIRMPAIRPDGWWIGLPEWSIPEDERIPRDRIGLRAVSH